MWRAVLLLCLSAPGLRAELVASEAARDEKVLSVFNVVTFPNSACGASNGYNGTCYTSSECTTKVKRLIFYPEFKMFFLGRHRLWNMRLLIWSLLCVLPRLWRGHQRQQQLRHHDLLLTLLGLGPLHLHLLQNWF